jgi:hypothetical protein
MAAAPHQARYALGILIAVLTFGCAPMNNIETIARVSAECRHEARKATESDQRRAVLEEQCFERRRAEWDK